MLCRSSTADHLRTVVVLDQVVFEGDKLLLQCRALTPEVSADDIVTWLWADKDPAHVFQHSIQVLNKHIKDNGFIERCVTNSLRLMMALFSCSEFT